MLKEEVEVLKGRNLETSSFKNIDDGVGHDTESDGEEKGQGGGAAGGPRSRRASQQEGGAAGGRRSRQGVQQASGAAGKQAIRTRSGRQTISAQDGIPKWMESAFLPELRHICENINSCVLKKYKEGGWSKLRKRKLIEKMLQEGIKENPVLHGNSNKRKRRIVHKK